MENQNETKITLNDVKKGGSKPENAFGLNFI